ncbi:MAG: glycogen/starch synthase, partial [Armatimonadetes bacterium]|nr:glycogen/starch synthase [Armatimonadota bacterium]
MKVLLASAEVVPFAKVGGLADVAGSLPKALAQLDIDIRVIMPKYQTAAQAGADMWRVVPGCPVPMADGMSGCALDESRLPGSEVPIYFVEHHEYFSRPHVYGPPGGAYPDNLERLTFFCRAILAVREPLNWQPDVVHLNDWHTSLVAVYLKQPDVGGPQTVYTAHNLGSAYQGTFPAKLLEVTGLESGDPGVGDMLHQGQLNLARAGLACADMVNTVSEKYAQEIETPESGPNICDLVQARREDVWGILNGIDYGVWNPATDEALAANFSADDVSGKAQCKQALQEQMGLAVNSDIPLIGMVTRLDAQKGLDILAEALSHIQGAQLVVLGTGDRRYENMLREAAASQENVAAVIDFSGELARQIYAGSDMFLMPS